MGCKGQVTTFGLVHGAYHGAWCWSLLAPELTALGYRCVTVDLPCESASGGAAEYAVAAADAFADVDDDLVVVGHSLAGLTNPFDRRGQAGQPPGVLVRDAAPAGTGS